MDAWNNFYVAQVGARAALAGLLFVGISISLQDILKFPHLIMRAAGSLTLLAMVLLISTLMLIPGESFRGAGFLVLLFGLTGLVLTVRMGVGSLRSMLARYRFEGYFIIGLKLLATLLFSAGGAELVATDARGDELIVGACVVTYIAVLLDTWVLLIDVHR